MAASTEGMVPITREYLACFYDNYPFHPLSDDVARLTGELRVMSEQLLRGHPPSPGDELLVREAGSPAPQKVDANLWKNREHLEEILYLLDTSCWPSALQQQSTADDLEVAAVLRNLQSKMIHTFKTLESFQSKHAENIFNIVMSYMPQDFRGSIIRQQRERSERNRQAEVDNLINSGGKIRDRYTLLWNQQMERRRQLAQLGSASGVYKALVKYLVGVPQVLLDFVKQINDDNGPMEEQRQRYGPSLYSLTSLLLSIHLFLHLSWTRYQLKKFETHELALFEEAVNVYTSEFQRFLKFIGEVFSNSPFFITAEEAGAGESSKKDEYKETIIPAGKTHEILLTAESVDSYIAWNFSVLQGKVTVDIGFRVEHIGINGNIKLVLPNQRFTSNQGNFSAYETGCYKLIWDNSYSNFLKKSLRYKVDLIPPVVETPRLAAADSTDPVL